MPRKGYKPSIEVCQKISKANKGRKKPEGFGEKISKALKGKPKSEEHKKKLSESHLGQLAWNKNKHPTQETLRKQSISHQGKKLTEEQKKKIGDAVRGHPQYFFKHTKEEKRKISEAQYGRSSGMKDKKHNEITKQKISEGNKGKIVSIETRKKLSQANWIDGRSFLPYCEKFNKQLKEKIRSRDNHLCQYCNAKENERKLDVHHIHYDKTNCYPDLISLCNRCNVRSNHNRPYYESLFMNILNSRGLLFWTQYHI